MRVQHPQRPAGRRARPALPGQLVSPEVLPAPKAVAARPGAELPYVLFSEEDDLTTKITIRTEPANLEWVCCSHCRCAVLFPKACAPAHPQDQHHDQLLVWCQYRC